MIRFFILVSFLIVMGLSILTKYSPDYVASYVFLIFGILLAATIIKVSLDLFLSNKEEDAETKAQRDIFGEDEGRTYYDIEDYSKELRRRSSKMRSHRS